jgi:hypothetical protein
MEALPHLGRRWRVGGFIGDGATTEW